jgi:hypothetical protein
MGQKLPLAFTRLAAPVVMGVRFTGKAGSTVAGGGALSYVLPEAFVGVHGSPASS